MTGSVMQHQLVDDQILEQGMKLQLHKVQPDEQIEVSLSPLGSLSVKIMD